VVEGFQLLARSEGIIPALECAHAIAWIARESATFEGATVLVNLSGRGDKDVQTVEQRLKGPSHVAD
jgi:tryptophan synthase beta chain